MSWGNSLLILILASSLLPGIVIFFLKGQSNSLRTTLNLIGACIKIIFVIALIYGVYLGHQFETRWQLVPGIDLVLHADTLSVLFVGLSSVLWLVTTIYAIGYFSGTRNQSRFFGFFSLCVSATIGIALAGNLITFLIFYELLTLTTYPLVVHKGNAAALRAGKVYLIYTLAGGAMLIVGVAWLMSIAGPLDFTSTGILSKMEHLNESALKWIFFLLIAGLGVKAALFPLHGWLPKAMVAPAPVSSLLHAVAVVKAGAFGIVRVVYDVYGVEYSNQLGLLMPLAYVASFTIIFGSVRALFQDELKPRLAYSTISQVSYITLGTAIAGPLATVGGIVHLVHQGLMKITLFFCAGNFAETLKLHNVSELDGVGKRMPWTMLAFTIAALGMIGFPPLAGFISKTYLGLGALEANQIWVIWVLVASSALNAMYFLPILYRGWMKQPVGEWNVAIKGTKHETRWMLLYPPLVTAGLVIVISIFANVEFSPLKWAKLIAEREYVQ